MAEAAAFDLKSHAARMSRAWSGKAAWDAILCEAHEYAIPFRRPSVAQGQRRGDRVFDSTAIDSTFRGAGQLKEDLFPSNQDWFRLAAGPLTKRLIKSSRDGDTVAFNQGLQDLTDQILPHFQTGEFDLAASEMCLDLFASTGILLPVPGDDATPVRFVCLPADECALTMDGHRRVNGLSWRRMWTKRDLREAFPDASWPDGFWQGHNENPDAEVLLYQDFVKEGARWRCLARLDDTSAPPLRMWWRKAQPFVAARYHVVPGEVYGRGPIMLALPTIKVLNKVQEMTLRSAAINLLGLWGYRPGGAFNPDVHRMQPGAFWPVNSTGGLMGPDVTRLDPSGRALDTSSIITGELRAIVQRLLHDEQTPGKGKTPVSAEEILLHIQKVKAAYLGAFGRLINEIVPVIVPAVAEILYEKHLLTTELTIDQLLLGVEVVSPLASALRADHMQPLIQFIQLLAAAGQQIGRYVPLDTVLPELAAVMGVPARWIATADQRQAFDQQQALQQAAAVAAEMAVKNPELVTGEAAGQDGNVVPMRGAA